MMKLGGMMRQFQANHPKVLSFYQSQLAGGLPEGTVLELTVTKPDGNPVTCNFRVTADDLQMLNELKNMRKDG